ncbi:hypothetical protein Plhal304r1_c001g0004651 [Plasmopara halstedii]
MVYHQNQAKIPDFQDNVYHLLSLSDVNQSERRHVQVGIPHALSCAICRNLEIHIPHYISRVLQHSPLTLIKSIARSAASFSG